MKDETVMKDDLMERVQKALDKIRPYLATDGGDARILEISNNVVKLELLGACGNCPMSRMTLQAGVEESIKRSVPEIIAVEATNVTHPDDPNAKLPDNLVS